MLELIEQCYDAIPRPHARAEDLGPLRLFVRDGDGHPYYARPVRPGVTVTADDVLRVRARQCELGVPEEFEWVVELAPALGAACEEAGLVVRRCPLLVLDGDPVTPPGTDAGVVTRVLDDDDEDLAAADAVAAISFRAGGVDVGPAGPRERDDHARSAGRPAAHAVRVVGTLPGAPGLPGPLAVGSLQWGDGGAEVVGVATLPAARHRGLAGAVTAHLARYALADGARVVFLSAQDLAVAGVYERVGFRRVGTAGLAEPAVAVMASPVPVRA